LSNLRETTVLVVANQKGGVGKTATAVNIAAGLASLKLPTLLVDLDPQGNATSTLGLRHRRPGGYELLLDGVQLGAAKIESGREKLDLVPASEDMAALEVELSGVLNRELRLRAGLDAARGRYSYVVVDCPPTLGLLTINGLMVADEVIVPVQCEYLALEGLSRFVATLDRVGEIRGNGPLQRRYLMTMYDRRTNLSREVVRDVRAYFGTEVVRFVVPRSVRLAEAPGFGRTIFEHDPAGAGALAYMMLSEEIRNGTTA
jgi:chromosome partitioning protein